MKTNRLYLLAVAAVAMLSMNSCQRMAKAVVDKAIKEVTNHNYEDSEEWGKVVTRDLELGDFSRVRIAGVVKFVLSQDSVCHIQAYGNEKRIEAYDITVEDGMLRAELKMNKDKITRNTPAITLYVNAPMIQELRVSGAGDLEQIDSFSQDEALEIEVNGAGDLDINDMETKSLEVSINGAGDVDIEHLRCQENVELKLSGAGDMDATIECRDLEASVNGAGDLDLNVKCDVLRVSCSGAGDIDLKGECRKLIKNIGRASDLDMEDLLVTEP